MLLTNDWWKFLFIKNMSMTRLPLSVKFFILNLFLFSKSWEVRQRSSSCEVWRSLILLWYSLFLFQSRLPKPRCRNPSSTNFFPLSLFFHVDDTCSFPQVYLLHFLSISCDGSWLLQRINDNRTLVCLMVFETIDNLLANWVKKKNC